MPYDTLQWSVTERVARLTLNRPDRLNSITVQMHGELRDALGRVEAEGARVLVLSGAGRAFCAGQDLADPAVTAESDLGDYIAQHYAPLIEALRALPMPTVAAVNGVAAGAGASLALACDLVVAASSASFLQPFCQLGLVPDSGATWLLPRLVGHARAMGLTLLGDRLPAPQAAEWGLIWKAVPDEEFAATVSALATRLAAAPTRGLVSTRHALQSAATHTLTQQLALEGELQRTLGRTHDYAEGVAAFLARRPPVFTGR